MAQPSKSVVDSAFVVTCKVADPVATGLIELPWDSDFLGVSVASIKADIPAAELPMFLDLAHASGVRLAYWASACDGIALTLPPYLRAAHIVDQVTLQKSCLYSVEFPEPTCGDYQLEIWKETSASQELLTLTLQAGNFSRFRLDPRLPPTTFERMYRIWIDRSCLGEMADEVQVVRAPDQSLAGMITLGVRDGVCLIGLISVSPGHQRKGLGRMLMQSAERFAREKNCRELSVVTQSQNLAAIRLYEVAGFAVAQTASWFHFWLDQDT